MLHEKQKTKQLLPPEKTKRDVSHFIGKECVRGAMRQVRYGPDLIIIGQKR